MVEDITKIMHGSLFCSSVFISVCVFNVWPKTTLLLLVWLLDAKSLDTPVLKEKEQIFRLKGGEGCA